MRKIIFLSLLILLLICPLAGAFEDNIERYSSGLYSEVWDLGGSVVTTPEYPDGTHQHALYFPTQMECQVGTKQAIFTNKLSFVVRNAHFGSTSGNNRLTVIFDTQYDQYVYSVNVWDYSGSSTTHDYSNVTCEFVTQNNRVLFYRDGIYQADLGASNELPRKIRFYSAMTNGSIYIDDISTEGSQIGVAEVFYETTDKIDISWKNEAYSSYPNSVYTIDTYCLTGSNPGKVDSQTLHSQSGMFSIPHSTLNENYGIYMIELKRDGEVMKDQYFVYCQSSLPIEYPDLLFLASSDASAGIRDENNGGYLSGGGSIYLYPTEKESGIYNFSYAMDTSQNSIITSITKIYANSPINGANVHYSGLEQSYNVSVDGEPITKTGNSNTYDYSFSSWGTSDTHTISFSMDYSAAGVWGEVIDSETNKGIKSATVSISGTNFSKTIYTDDNGIYYYSKGMEIGKAYTVTVSKPGYTAPPAQTSTVVEGQTTRQDFYLDPLVSTEGAGLYYATHDVTFTVLPYWYSHIGVPGVEYTVTGNGTVKAAGYTDSKGKFAIEDMKAGTAYTFDLRYNGTNHSEIIMPSGTEYNIVLNNQPEIIHQYYNNWLNLSYSENNRNISISYVSNKSAAATAILKYSNGTIADTKNLNTQTGTFNFNNLPSANDYIINFNITSSDGEKASQSWVLSAFQKVTLFPDSYPAWLKNTLFVAIILVFMLAFGKSKNDVACLSAAVLTSLGHFFGWLICPYYLVILIWIIALGAVYLHYKRTGAMG